MIRRINLFGGPGTGKSTMAAGLFYELKSLSNKNNHNKQYELVREYVKNWAWEGRKISGYDQFYIFSKQLRAEEICLKNGVDVIVTDSPLALSYMYTVTYNLEARSEIRNATLAFEKQYPSLNVMLVRDDNKPYNSKGRFQTLEEARQLDLMSRLTLKNLEFPYIEVTSFDLPALVNAVATNSDCI